jgi:hypothetical protein
VAVDKSPEYRDPPAPDNVLEKRLHELREQAKTYSKAEAERVYLDHFIGSTARRHRNR